MKEPIRILQMIGSLDIGGSQSMIINLYNAIDREKVQFDFICDNPYDIALKSAVVELGAKVYFLPKFNGLNVREIKKSWDVFFTQHPEYKVLHSHVRSYASLFLPIAKKHGLKTIIHSHNTSNGRGISAIYKAILQYPLRFQADYYIGCSREAGEWLFGKKRVANDRYFMLPNAIDLDKYRFNQEMRNKLRDALAISNNQCYVHVGRLTPQKNHVFLLETFSEIVKQDSSSVLLIVGDGELKETIIRKIDELHLSRCVRLLGNRNDVHQILQAADCFLFPSLFEGLPVTVVEAQAAGLPCYISDTVTKDVKVSPLARYLPINKGADLWAERIMNDDLSRLDVSEDIKKAGFDITESAKQMESFYLSIHEA